jgi:hypothetical protein
MKNDVTKWCTIAGMLRQFTMSTVDFYLPAYFLQTYPMFAKEFSALFALSVVVGGFSMSFGGGILGDKLG